MLRWIVFPSIVSAVAFLLVVQLCRSLARTSPVIARVVAAGVALRLGAGLILFWVSYLHAPILSSLQLGGGFWTLALDAQGYHAVALHGAEDGAATISSSTASPAYVRALAGWMSIAGTSPFSSVLFNTICYVLTCVLLLRVFGGPDWPRGQPSTTTAIVALTFSPMLLFVSTQTLKDDFFVLIAAGIAAGVFWLSSPRPTPRHFHVAWAAAVLAVTIGIYVAAGIRVYYAFLVWCALGPFSLWMLITREGRRWWTLGAGAATLVAGLAGFLAGAGVEGPGYLSVVTGSKGAAIAGSLVQHARTGFITSGGNTNVARRSSRSPGGTGADESVQIPDRTSLADKAEAVVVGLGTLFVPLSVLRALSVVSVEGSGASRILSDVDTIFLDLTLVLSCVLMIREWRATRVLPPYAIFSGLIGAVLTVLLAYVVTNVGTLVRLRLMLVIPFWTLPLAWRAYIGERANYVEAAAVQIAASRGAHTANE